MAIDRTGISSLNAGAGEITYSGNEGPKSPQQMAEFELMEFMEEFESVFPEMKSLRGTEEYMQSLNEYFRGLTKQESREGIQMASAEDPILKDEYDRYVFELKEIRPEATPMTIEEFRQQAISGMAYGGTAKPTYTQSRKQRMAYGGIAGLDGRKKYGIGSFFQDVKDKFVDDIIPNEIKDNPILSSVVMGGLLDRYGVPFTGIPGDRMGQDWFKDLINVSDYEDLIGSNVGETVRNIGSAGLEGISGIGGMIRGGFEGLSNLLPENLSNTLFGSSQIGGRDVNWKTPLAIGTAMGAAQAAMPKDVLPQDTSGINIPAIREAALRGEGGAFLPRPEATTAYAQGGRIGFKNGSSDYKDFLKDKEDGIISPDTTFNEWLDNNAPDPDYDKIYAKGGRIGYANGGNGGGGDPIAEIVALMRKRMLGGLTLEETDRLDELIKDTGFMEQKAQGGRIGFDNGGFGIMDGIKAAYGKGMDKDIPKRKKDEDLTRDEVKRIKMAVFEVLDKTAKGGQSAGSGTFIDNLGDALEQFVRPDLGAYIQDYTLGTGIFADDFIIGGEKDLLTKAQGGRIGAQEGGLMDLGGMEKDYREEGGFVPIGGQERADDVPARLSKNEFVFTADAVRAAGGGDIDAGAEVMENLMNNLEQGGQVSEESQGLEGARNMFATAQRLEGVM